MELVVILLCKQVGAELQPVVASQLEHQTLVLRAEVVTSICKLELLMETVEVFSLLVEHQGVEKVDQYLYLLDLVIAV
jgi:hypothetical protein